jgi:hypothetical protein
VAESLRQNIRIASGQGFWGDLQTAPLDQVTKGPIDYLVMDFLAEVTMSILQKQKHRNPDLGYAKDLIAILEQVLPICVDRNIRIITNGGGVNPAACADSILSCASRLGMTGLKVGIVSGDDILPRLAEFQSNGLHLSNMDTGERLDEVHTKFLSANVYFGAGPIVEALRLGAQIVVTGRTTDTALTLAPMMHEFGWANDDWNKLAGGIVAGHILECGGQASGGNFSENWRSVPDLAHLGFPIAEAESSGDIVITKHPHTGGSVTTKTVKEQLLYEIGDPRRYVTPDVVVDFTSIRVDQVDENRIRVFGVRGEPSTDSYKVSMAYQDGYAAIGSVTYSWPDALEKAQVAENIVRTRLADAGLKFEAFETEFLGLNSCHGPIAERPDIINEVVLRIGVRGHNYSDVERFGKELAPLILTGPPGATGFGSGRPKPKEVISFWPALIPKSAVHPSVSVQKL